VNCRTVTLDGHQRRYKVYIPASALAIGQRPPLVYMFHGGSGDGEQFLRMSGWRELSDATGMVSVFPTAMRYRIIENGAMSTRWNSFKLSDPLQTEIDTSVLPPGSAAGSPVPADDVGFVDHMTSDLRARLPIDRRRIYASGFSNGAAFAERLSIERSEEIAAVAYSGGGLPDVHSPTRPVPTYRTTGTLDPNVLANTNPLLTELPLDPVGILTNSTLDPLLDNILATLGLDAGDFGAVSQPHSTTLRWPPTGTAPNGAQFTFGMIGGLTHMYPKADNSTFVV